MKETPTEERAEAPHPTAARPPSRKLLSLRQSHYTRKEQVLIWSLLAVIVIAALPLGAYLAMQVSQRQHTPVNSTPPQKGAGVVPRQLDPDRREAAFIDQTISQMSLDEELGQMIMVEWDEGGVMNSDLQYMIDNEHAGGIILYTFNDNIQTRPQVTALTASIQADAKIP